jgi:hypothetical protein
MAKNPILRPEPPRPTPPRPPRPVTEEELPGQDGTRND